MDHSLFEHPGTVRVFSATGEHQQQTLLPPPTDSPDDPLMWSSWRKAWHTVLLVFITGLTAALANCIGSAQYAMSAELGISDASFSVAIALIFIGIGTGTLLLSPAPRLLGRRITFILCLMSGLAGSAMFGSVQRKGLLIASQGFLGLSDACAEAMVQHSLSDIYFAHQRGSIMGIYVLAISGGTFLGPLVASFVVNSDKLGWPWIGWLGIIFSGTVLLLVALGLEETSFSRDFMPTWGTEVCIDVPQAPITNGKELDAPPEQLETMHSQTEAPTNAKKPYLSRIALVTTTTTDLHVVLHEYLRLLWRTPRCFIWPAVVFAGFQWGGQVTYLTFYLYVEDTTYYEAPFNYTDAAVGIMNVANLIGLVVGVLFGGVFADKFVEWQARRNGGISEPEHRLWLMFPCAIAGPVGLLLFGIGSQRGWDWPAPYVGLGLIGFNWGCAGDICLTYMQQSYPEAILECMVGMAVINNMIGMTVTFASGA